MGVGYGMDTGIALDMAISGTMERSVKLIAWHGCSIRVRYQTRLLFATIATIHRV
jgi:hypothetical protein